MGNSRAEVGFDPQHPAWPVTMRPVFNLSLPGTDTETTREYLGHAQIVSAPGSVRQLVWGLDFVDFLPDAPTPNPSLPGQDTQKQIAPKTAQQDLRSMSERLLSTLTLSAFIDTLATLAAQSDPLARHLSTHGFNPMRDYERIARQDGYHELFRQKNESYIRTMLNRAAGLPDYQLKRAPAFADLETVFKRCREDGIELKIVLYPYHANFLQILDLSGLSSTFDAWKQELVARTHVAATGYGQYIQVFDFSHYNAWTTESVPARDDKLTRLTWYWEAGHFKRELGDLILSRVLDPAFIEDDLGLLLNSSNVGRVAQMKRESAEQYKLGHALEVSALQDGVERERNAIATRRAAQ